MPVTSGTSGSLEWVRDRQVLVIPGPLWLVGGGGGWCEVGAWLGRGGCGRAGAQRGLGGSHSLWGADRGRTRGYREAGSGGLSSQREGVGGISPKAERCFWARLGCSPVPMTTVSFCLLPHSALACSLPPARPRPPPQAETGFPIWGRAPGMGVACGTPETICGAVGPCVCTCRGLTCFPSTP